MQPSKRSAQAMMSRKYGAEGLGQGQHHVTSFSIGTAESAFNVDLIDCNKIAQLTTGKQKPQEIEYKKFSPKIYFLSLNYLLHRKQCSLDSEENCKGAPNNALTSTMEKDIAFIQELINASSTQASSMFNQDSEASSEPPVKRFKF